MHKRISALALCLLLLLGTVLPVCAVEKKETEESEPIEITIASPAALLALAENCRLDTYSRNLVVYLAGDLDLSGMAFESIPIFSGTFDGRGHTISGLSVTADGSVQGLFRYLTGEAVVRDLSIMGQIRPGGSRSEVGAIAGRSEGSILNCSFRGNVSGGSYVGGLVGRNGTSARSRVTTLWEALPEKTVVSSAAAAMRPGSTPPPSRTPWKSPTSPWTP